jgi:hypothetical protein
MCHDCQEAKHSANWQMLNITVNEGQRGSPQGWRWSSGDAQAPLQRRGSDCGLFTVLYVILQARGWDIQQLGSLAPKAMRDWFKNTCDDAVTMTLMVQWRFFF